MSRQHRFINARGLLTLVECKLWRNPEARREVVGQILDYAKELNRWSYTDLQHAISRAQHDADDSLFELVAYNSEEPDERTFIDSETRNLRRGRSLLLIVGRQNRDRAAPCQDQRTNLLCEVGGRCPFERSASNIAGKGQADGALRRAGPKFVEGEVYPQ